MCAGLYAGMGRSDGLAKLMPCKNKLGEPRSCPAKTSSPRAHASTPETSPHRRRLRTGPVQVSTPVVTFSGILAHSRYTTAHTHTHTHTHTHVCVRAHTHHTSPSGLRLPCLAAQARGVPPQTRSGREGEGEGESLLGRVLHNEESDGATSRVSVRLCTCQLQPKP